MSNSKTFLFIPENTSWGGSELLWSKTAIELAKVGIEIHVLPHHLVTFPTWFLQAISNTTITLHKSTKPSLPWYAKISNRLLPYAYRIKARNNKKQLLQQLQPNLIIINQGLNFNGVETMELARTLKLPYVVISHAVNESIWPNENFRMQMKKGFQQSVANFFVSAYNKTITESQIGIQLHNATIVRNPYGVSYTSEIPYPPTEPFSLAFVGRYELYAKGQDILLRVLATKKWKERKLHINFYGEGEDGTHLKTLLDMYGIHNVSIHTHTPPEAIWETNHGLILTSRFEGLPIVVVEAMLSKRMVIVTDVSGSTELVIDNETGFIAAAAKDAYVDEALERAWQQREQWEAMGIKAYKHIHEYVYENPAKDFATRLLTFV